MRRNILGIAVLCVLLTVGAEANTCGHADDVFYNDCNSCGGGSPDSPSVSGHCCEWFPQMDCCGVWIEKVGDGVCHIAELRSPETRAQVLLAAEQSDLLLPDCNGAFVPAEWLLAKEFKALRLHRSTPSRLMPSARKRS